MTMDCASNNQHPRSHGSENTTGDGGCLRNGWNQNIARSQECTLVRVVSLNDEGVLSGFKRHHEAGLQTAGIVDIGDLRPSGLEVAAGVEPKPGVECRTLTRRKRVLLGRADSKGVPMLARRRTNHMCGPGGVASKGAAAGDVTRRLPRGLRGWRLCASGGERVRPDNGKKGGGGNGGFQAQSACEIVVANESTIHGVRKATWC